MIAFRLDVRLWRCGNARYPDSTSLGGDQTMLYHPDYTAHNMCVLGQLLHQAGADLRDLARLCGADTYREFVESLPGWSPPQLLSGLLDLLTVPLDSGYRHSDLARRLVDVNDDLYVARRLFERYVDLRDLLAPHGLDLLLVNYEPSARGV